MSWIRLVILMAVVALVGCDTGKKVTPPSTSAKDSVKKALEGLVKSGRGGSEIGAIQQELKKLQETDKALADELAKDASGLMSTKNSSDDIKAKAQEMLKKLEGGGGGGAAPKQ
jgi:hypothetical protein